MRILTLILIFFSTNLMCVEPDEILDNPNLEKEQSKLDNSLDVLFVKMKIFRIPMLI